MMKTLLTPQIILLFAFLALFSCDEDDGQPGLRAKIAYETLTPTTPYATAFKDATGASTVDLTEGNTRYKMFYSINNYISSRISANEEIDAQVLRNMFSNTGDPFYDISASVTVEAEALNNSDIQLKDAVAVSKGADAAAERETIEGYFDRIETASTHILETASPGQAGKLENRLLDAKGIELAQVIQKAFIGALQLDYIGNTLMDEGLTADNSQLVSDENYTALEHNWDVAYGMLTLNPIYLEGSTDDEKGTYEFGAGSYIWEYNKNAYADVYPAFLKGRAAIVNNDPATLQDQATFIRTAFETAIAKAALGYLSKWKTDTDDAARAHHIGEGLGFIYSLRYATLHGADAAFSDDIIENLVGSTNGFWDIDAARINAASEAIQQKFDL